MIDSAFAPRNRTERYSKCIEMSKRVRWDIEEDVIRGRHLDFSRKFMPDALARIERFDFATASEKLLVSQIQGRSYANMFGLVERFIGAKMLQISSKHWLGDQTALEALVRLTDEELKHQELFRRIELLVADRMPAGYTFSVAPNDVASFVLGKSTWAVLALTCHIELFSQAHYRASIGPTEAISPLFKDVFLFHWREESQHAIIDEMEWQSEDAKLGSAAERDAAVDDLIALVGGVDGILQAQARADASYFMAVSGIAADSAHGEAILATLLKAYRWQYIVSGVQEPRFVEVLKALVTPPQMERIGKALAPILAHVGH